VFFFFNDTATTEIYTLSLHDALPICGNCWYIKSLPVLQRRLDMQKSIKIIEKATQFTIWMRAIE